MFQVHLEELARPMDLVQADSTQEVALGTQGHWVVVLFLPVGLRQQDPQALFLRDQPTHLPLGLGTV